MVRVVEVMEEDADLGEGEFAPRRSGAGVELRSHRVQSINGCRVGHGSLSIEERGEHSEWLGMRIAASVLFRIGDAFVPPGTRAFAARV